MINPHECAYCHGTVGKQQPAVRDESGCVYCSNFCFVLATGAYDTASAMVFDQEDRQNFNPVNTKVLLQEVPHR